MAKSFFSEGVGLAHHFKIKHRSMSLNENIIRKSKKLFQGLHRQETQRILAEISERRVKAVRIFCNFP